MRVAASERKIQVPRLVAQRVVQRMVYGARSESTGRPATDERHVPDLISVPNPCTRGGPCSGFLYRERNLRKSSAILVVGPAAARIVTHFGPCLTLSRPYFLGIGYVFELRGGILNRSSPAWSAFVPGFSHVGPTNCKIETSTTISGMRVQEHQVRYNKHTDHIVLWRKVADKRVGFCPFSCFN